MMVTSKAKAFLPKKFKPPSADYQLIGDVDHHPMTRRAHPWHFGGNSSFAERGSKLPKSHKQVMVLAANLHVRGISFAAKIRPPY